ncbi:baculoviral IAP repeat-containing protein 2-like [Mytilus edulis]|uniref:baculoviral IAP repeat-containing protein 2-like n=1 Tax=Mytilus edulis TaxID=6550 RepID=UPI0039F0F509
MKIYSFVTSIKVYHYTDGLPFSCPFYRQNTFRNWPLESQYPRKYLLEAGFYFCGGKTGIHIIRCFVCGISTIPTTWKTNETPVEAHKRLSKCCSFITNWCNDSRCDFSYSTNISTYSTLTQIYVHKDYAELKKRMDSFKNCSYKEMLKQFKHAARTGLFYSDDSLICCCCNFKLYFSDSEDVMWQRHVLFSPDCFYLRETKGVDFVKNSQKKWRKIFKPYNKMMVDVESRIETFKTKWATTVRQTPEMLAYAGFYYVGEEEGDTDCVRCFYCDKGLKRWEPSDEPWTEHIFKSKECKFVELMRGNSYIKHVCENYKTKNENKQPNRESQEYNNKLTLSEMGFSVDDIQYAISKFADKSEGCCNYDIEDLLNILIQRHESTRHNDD